MSRRPASEQLPRLRVSLDVLPLVGFPSGVGAACRALVEALDDRQDIDLRSYAVARKAFLAGRELPRRIPFRATPIPTRLAQTSWRFGSPPGAELVAGRVDVVHGVNFAVPPSRRAATVVTVHDMTALRYPELCTNATLDYPDLVRSAVGRGALVHVPSAFVRDELVELLEIAPEMIEVIYWGVPPVAELTIPPAVEAPYVLALGTVEPRKDYPTLVEAFAEVAARHRDLRLVLAGADAWGTEALTEVVAEKALEDRVVRLGYVNESERSALLWNASLLAYPSLYEGFGFPPLEAMAVGVPVVATKAGGVPEVVGDAALLVEPRQSGELAAAIESLLEDDELRNRLVTEGEKRAAAFSWTETAEQMVALYRRAAGKPAP